MPIKIRFDNHANIPAPATEPPLLTYSRRRKFDFNLFACETNGTERVCVLMNACNPLHDQMVGLFYVTCIVCDA